MKDTTNDRNRYTQLARVEREVQEPIEVYLKREYKTKSANAIGRELGVTPPTVIKWLKEIGVKTKNRAESLSSKSNKPTKEELLTFYERGYGTNYLSKKFNVSNVTVRNWYAHFGIKRDYKENWNAKKINVQGKIKSHCEKRNAGRRLEDIEKSLGEPIESYLEREYQDRHAKEIAADLRVSTTSVIKWLKKSNIPVRGLKEWREIKIQRPEESVLRRMHYEEGLGYTSIASEFSVTIDTVKKWFKQYDLTFTSKIKVSRGSWKDLSFAVDQAKKYLSEHPEYSVLPPSKTLIKDGYSSIVFASQVYHGGIVAFRKNVSQSIGRETHSQKLISHLERYANGEQ